MRIDFKLITVLTISIFLVFIAGCMKESANIPEENTASNDIVAQPQITYESFYDPCMEDKKGDIADCMTLVTGDLDYCSVWQEIAPQEDDEDACADTYYLLRMLQSGEFNCEKISNPDAKITCNAIALEDSDTCSYIPKYLKLCMALVLDDVKLCNNESNCLGVYYLFKAAEKNDISLCDSSESPINCKAFLMNDLDMCTKQRGEECNDFANLEIQLIKDREKMNLGANNRDITLCEEIHNTDMKTACTSAVNDNLDLCLSIKDEEFKFYCLIQLAESIILDNPCNNLKAKKKDCLDYFSNI